MVILAKVKSGANPPKFPTSFILEAIYRPAGGGIVSIEFPAGLVDEGESVEDAAIRELREEIGQEVERHQVNLLPMTSVDPGKF